MSISKIKEIRLEEFKNSLDCMGMKVPNLDGKSNVYKEIEDIRFVEGFNSAIEFIKEEFKKFFPNL